MTRWHHRLLHQAIGLWTRARRPVTLGVKAAIFDDAGRILLVRHSYIHGWHIPGGGVERNETTAEAAAREVAEEVGLTVSRAPELFHVYFAPHMGKSDHIVLYRVEVEHHDVSTNWEIEEAGFFAPDALPEGVTAATRRRVAELLGEEIPPPRW